MVLTVLSPLYPVDPVLAPSVDIVIVHGLNGDAVQSWTDSTTNAFWPEDFLPYDVPEARVLTFGYNADVAFGNTTADIVDHAKDLLGSLIDKREEENETRRPIVFIAHSLGGIIVKQALFLARIEPQYTSISESTIGIVFFGTPHRGSDKAAYGKILGNVASTVMHKPTSKLLSALQSNSDVLARLTSDFRHQLPNYQIVTFYETKPQGVFKTEIVEKQSAVLELAKEDQIPVDANHQDMCKFSTRQDGDYEKLFKRIRRIMKAKGNMDQSGGHSRNKYYLVPHNVSTLFTGRDDVFKKLLQNCVSSQNFTIQRRFVLYGLGGSGKTQVSLKFAQDYCESFWGIFWIDCSTMQTIEQGFSKIGQICQVKGDLQSIRDWLSNITEQWLLIFDNADDPSINLSNYFPAGTRGTILITTRNPECRNHQTVGSYELADMGTEDGIDLLLKSIEAYDLSPSTLREKARTITETLGNLALAIVQAGAVIRQKLCPIEDYCGMYQRRRRELLSRAPTQASSDYKYTVYTTWEVSINMIERMGSEVAIHALELLRLFSFLHFDGISEEIFEEAWVNKIGETLSDGSASSQFQWVYKGASNTWDPYYLRESIFLLSSFSLIKIDSLSNNLSMHPLVHTWARDRLSEVEQGRWVLKTAVLLADSISWERSTSGYEFRRSLASHVTICLQVMTLETLFTSGIGVEECWNVAERFAQVLSESGQWQSAMQLQEKVYETRKRTLGEEDPDTLNSMGNLAISYSDLGRGQEAVQLREKVYKASKRTLGEEHPDTLISMGNLAASYSNLGRAQDAVQLEEKVYKTIKRTLGEEDPDTLNSMGNLAISYSDLGRGQEAVQLREKVYKASKRTLGEEHPDTLISMGNLAASYSNLGRAQEAVQLKEKVYKASKRTLGEEHPDTLISMGNLAASYSNLGRAQDAVQLAEKVYKARKRTLGEEHPDTLRILEYYNYFLQELHEETQSQNKTQGSAIHTKDGSREKTKSRWKSFFK